MPIITATLDGEAMPTIERDFINTPTENATDVQVLSGELYTDFVSIIETWTFNYSSLTQAQYEALRDIYNSQFEAPYQYPVLAIPFFGLNSPARMYINEKNIWNNCGDVQGVQFIFRVTEQLEGSS